MESFTVRASTRMAAIRYCRSVIGAIGRVIEVQDLGPSAGSRMWTITFAGWAK